MKKQTLKQNNGFTLIELLVSVVILTVGLLGMFTSINIAMDANLTNQLRNKAISVAESEMSSIKSRPFANIIGSGTAFKRVGLGASFKNISTAYMVSDISTSNVKTRQISVRVWWKHKNKNYEHQVSSSIGDTGVN